MVFSLFLTCAISQNCCSFFTSYVSACQAFCHNFAPVIKLLSVKLELSSKKNLKNVVGIFMSTRVQGSDLVVVN